MAKKMKTADQAKKVRKAELGRKDIVRETHSLQRLLGTSITVVLSLIILLLLLWIFF